MKHICFDHGEKRTGAAVSDADGRLAFPSGVVLKKSREQFFADIVSLVDNERAELVVVGLPLRGDGSESLASRQARNFAQSLARRLDIPVYFMEEAYSSFEAESMLKESRQKAYKRDGRVDSLAAARILESFLRQPEHLRMAVKAEGPRVLNKE